MQHENNEIFAKRTNGAITGVVIDVSRGIQVQSPMRAVKGGEQGWLLNGSAVTERKVRLEIYTLGRFAVR